MEGLDLQERERSADLVRGPRLPQHQTLAPQRLHTRQFLAKLRQSLAALMLVQPGVGLPLRSERFGQKLQPRLEASLAARCVKDEKADLLPEVTLVLTPDNAHRALKLLAADP